MDNTLNPTAHQWTKDKQPVISGTSLAEKGNVARFVLNNIEYQVDIHPETGAYSWQPPFPLEDGEYTLSIYFVDKAQNIGLPKQIILHVDTTAPDKPEILRVIDDQGVQQGWLTPDARTDDSKPAFSGIAEPDSLVHLMDGANVIGSAKADSNGRWEITPEQELAEGEHTFTVTSTDGREYVSQPSDSFKLTVEGGSSTPFTIEYATDNEGNYTGSVGNGALTDDTTPTLHGRAPAGSLVQVEYRTENGSWFSGGAATVNGGSWNWTPNPALAAGKYEFRASTGGKFTDLFTLNIQPGSEDQVDILHAIDDAGRYTGQMSNNAITDDTTPTLVGRAHANSIVYLHARTGYGAWALLGSVKADDTGNWTFTADVSSPGSYQFSAGTQSFYTGASAPFNLNIITPGSYAPVIESAWDNVGPLQGRIDNGQTDDTTPTLQGVAEANSTVLIEYYQEGSSQKRTSAVQAGSDGKWTFTPPALPYGTWVFEPKTETGTTGRGYKLEIAADVKGNAYTDFSNFNYLPWWCNLAPDEVYEIADGVKVTILDKQVNRIYFGSYNSYSASPYFLSVEGSGTKITFDHGTNYLNITSNRSDDFWKALSYYDMDGSEIPSSALKFTGNELVVDEKYKLHHIILDKLYIFKYSYAYIYSITWEKPLQSEYHMDFDNQWIGLLKGFPAGSQQLGKDGILFANTGNTDIKVTSPGLNTTLGKKALSIPTDSLFSIDFKGTKEISLDLLAHSATTPRVTVTVYDIYHNIIGVHTYYPQTDKAKTYTISGEYGESIGLVEIATIGGVYLDNLRWSAGSETTRVKEMVYNFEGLNIDSATNNITHGDIKISSGSQAILKTATNDYMGKPNLKSLYAATGTDVTVDLTKKTSYVYFDISNADTTIDFYNASNVKIGSKTVTTGSTPTGVRFDAPQGEDIARFVINKTKGTYIDNITTRYHDEQPQPLFDQPAQNDVLALNSVEELNSTAVIGHDKNLDTLQIEGANQLLDLNNVAEKVKSVEIFDITGSGDNTLRIDAESLLAHGAKDVFIEDGKTQLMVNGNEGDVVQLADILPEGEALSGWTQEAGTVTVAGVAYNVYSNGEAELLVQEGVKTELM